MDATNERRVFELIVDITSMKNSSQYFLLTPKVCEKKFWQTIVNELSITFFKLCCISFSVVT